MDRGAWPFLVGGIISLITSVSVCKEKKEERKGGEKREEKSDGKKRKEKKMSHTHKPCHHTHLSTHTYTFVRRHVHPWTGTHTQTHIWTETQTPYHTHNALFTVFRGLRFCVRVLGRVWCLCVVRCGVRCVWCAWINIHIHIHINNNIIVSGMCLCRVVFFESGGKVGGKLHLKFHRCLTQPTGTVKERCKGFFEERWHVMGICWYKNWVGPVLLGDWLYDAGIHAKLNKNRRLILTRGRACSVRWRVCLGRHICSTINRSSELVSGREIASAKRREKTWYGNEHQITVQDWSGFRIKDITIQDIAPPKINYRLQ